MLGRLTQIAGGIPSGETTVVGSGDQIRAIGGAVQYEQREYEMRRELGEDPPKPDLVEVAKQEYLDVLNSLASTLGYDGVIELTEEGAREFIVQKMSSDEYANTRVPTPPSVERPADADPAQLEEYYITIASYLDQMIQTLINDV
jgi:hypothetical protein